MLEAGLWGLAGSSALVIGAFAGLATSIPHRLVALLMAFGSGALISALAFDLTEEAFAVGGTVKVAVGLAIGALTFFGGNRLIDRRGGARRGTRTRHVNEGTGPAIVLGALLDGIPESVVLGSTLLAGAGVGFPFLAAVVISNLPESLSATVALRRGGHPARWIIGVWVLVALASAMAAAAGYALLGEMSGSELVPLIQAFAAGAILTMLSVTMIPHAFDEGGDLAGLATVFGFALAFLLSKVS